LRFPIVLAATLAVTLVTAALSWFLVEQPILRRKQRPPWRPDVGATMSAEGARP
jgi:peptidoglycan/LPS O-acetylase OafA/YrhL